jgi:hypothetical protein
MHELFSMQYVFAQLRYNAHQGRLSNLIKDREVSTEMSKEERSTKLFPLEDAASQELGGISVWYLRKAIAQGIIKPTRLGTRIFLSGDEIARIQRDGLPSLKNNNSVSE